MTPLAFVDSGGDTVTSRLISEDRKEASWGYPLLYAPFMLCIIKRVVQNAARSGQAILSLPCDGIKLTRRLFDWER